ncbi:MAG TPA: response regulator [Ignavibacteriales bacterium]|nr:response regulator [Ignavibacteriales bacterium]
MYKILIIEDQETVRNNIEYLLRRMGYETFSASNGIKGLELAREIVPDLIICDIMMPQMNGYEVLKNLNADRCLSLIPFLFLTAKAEKSDFRLGMELGADDYLAKPFEAADLLAAVKTRLEKRENLLNAQNNARPAPPAEENSKPNTPADHKLTKDDVVMLGSNSGILKISSIVCISAADSYSNVFTIDGKKLMARKLLKHWEAVLPDELFLRIHKSTIINTGFIERVEKWFNNALRFHMRGYSEPLESSRRYAPKVKARFRI